jgi:ectoine hydroxylase-related dioxygenase (phytanoyl-CoA dioxygenase family)
MNLREFGHASIRSGIAPSTLSTLRDRVFVSGEVGTRCLLDESLVRNVAEELREALVAADILQSEAKAIQAIAFDKTPSTNWKVTWHQDVMFPFARPVSQMGFDLPSRKDGVDYARPPRKVLEDLLAVRLHLDDCDSSNGPLRVAPGSHVYGIIRDTEIADCLARHGETVCIAKEGDALLMKPLLLHASSAASDPKHRRVIHIVYYSGGPILECWHRSI